MLLIPVSSQIRRNVHFQVAATASSTLKCNAFEGLVEHLLRRAES